MTWRIGLGWRIKLLRWEKFSWCQSPRSVWEKRDNEVSEKMALSKLLGDWIFEWQSVRLVEDKADWGEKRSFHCLSITEFSILNEVEVWNTFGHGLMEMKTGHFSVNQAGQCADWGWRTENGLIWVSAWIMQILWNLKEINA